MDAAEAFIAELKREFPRFRIIDKRNSPLSKAIDGALKVITLGGQSRYLSHYHTVIGDRLYVPDGWDDTPAIDKVITLRHERVHLRQRRRYTLGGMTLLYLLLPLPLGLAYGRATMEMEAYEETLRATFELKGRDALLDPVLKARITRQFTSAAYGWMWPFPKRIDRWYDRIVARLIA